jgi:glutathione synthase/RimK-type ligase-like ATP-grasp enzyme
VNRYALILSSLRHDVHASAVRWALRRSGRDALWVTSPADGELAPVSLHSDGQTEWRASGWLDPTEVSAVWFRRAHKPEAFARAHERDWPFLRTEWARFLRNVHALADELSLDRLWVNRPAAAAAAENKLVQLQAARRAGLRFPPTLVSHHPAAIRRFAESHGRVVYKPFMPHTWQDAGGRMFSTFARLLEPSMLDDDASLSLCPGIYQAYVDKRHDLRIVAIGAQLFAVSLSAASGEAFVDWRAHTYASDLRAQVTSLPAGLRDRLRALLAELGLVFGCIDVAVDRAGEPHFLEVNQAGQFLFLEEMAGGAIPLLRAMCALLAEGRVDASLDVIAPDLSYASYCASDEHAIWRESVRGDLEAANRGGAWLTVE